jgi:glycerol-3-phosphate dehydrogenase
MDVKVRREDVTSAWSGIRPLVKPSTAKDTASISRDHLIEVLNDNVITIVGNAISP